MARTEPSAIPTDEDSDDGRDPDVDDSATEGSTTGGAGNPPASELNDVPLRNRVAPVLLPLLLVVVLLGPHLIGVRSLSPADQLYNWEPWASDRPADATLTHNAPLSDNFDGVFPQREQVTSRMRSGDWPLWNPFSSGGVDLATSIGVGAASPSNAIALVTPGWYTPALLKALEIMGSWAFVFLFLRRVGTQRFPASIAGVIFALSGFQVVWVNWPHTRVAMFSAGMLWAFDRLIERTTPDRIAIAALIVGATILEGFPAVAAVGAGTAGLILAFRLVQLSNGVWDAAKRAAGAASAGVLGAMLSAITVVPFASRLGSYGLEREVPANAALARGMGTLLAPNILGPAEKYFGPINYIEIGGFIGSAALLACGAGVLVTVFSGRPRARDLLLLLTVVAGTVLMLYSFGIEPIYDIFRRFPVMSTNQAMRMKASGLLLLSLGAGLSMDRLARPIPDRRLRWAASGWILLLLAGAIAYLLTFVRGAPADLHAYVRGEALRAIILAVVAAVALITLIHRAALTWFRVGALGTVAAVVAVDAVAWIVPYWPRSQPDEFYPETTSHEFLAETLGEERFGALSLTFFPGTSTYYGLRNVSGHNFFDQRWKESLASAGALLRSPTFATFENPASASSPALDRLGVAYWADPSGLARCRSDITPTTAKPPDGDDSSVTTETTGPGVRGLTFKPSRDLPRGTRIVLEARADGNETTGERTLATDTKAGDLITVMVPGLELEDGPVRLTLHAGSGSIALGTPEELTACMGHNDGLVLVHTGGAWIYRRTNALPRFRWAGDVRVIEDQAKRIAALRAGDLDRNTVVLSGPTVAATGGRGTVNLVGDSLDSLEFKVDANGGGFLVVADPIQLGWTATVDGTPTKIIAADHAGGAIPVTKGRHTVVISYDPPGLRTGLLISGIAAIMVTGLLGAAAYQEIRRRNNS